MFSYSEILEIHNRRFATKKFDKNKKISEDDWNVLLEVARLSPSSFGLEPWKILLIENEDIKNDIKPLAWGALNSLEGASHFIIILAKKDLTYNSSHIKHIMEDVKNYSYNEDSAFAQRFKFYQEEDAQLNDKRSLFDWSSKQTYILLANMMTTAAMLNIDSCPIEGFNYNGVESYLSNKGLIDLDEYGISVMAGFGYKNQDITDKTRQNLSDIYKVID